MTAHVEKDGVVEERGEYSVLTLGCPAAHCLSFKHRGLVYMVRERQRVSVFEALVVVVSGGKPLLELVISYLELMAACLGACYPPVERGGLEGCC